MAWLAGADGEKGGCCCGAGGGLPWWRPGEPWEAGGPPPWASRSSSDCLRALPDLCNEGGRGGRAPLLPRVAGEEDIFGAAATLGCSGAGGESGGLEIGLFMIREDWVCAAWEGGQATGRIQDMWELT